MSKYYNEVRSAFEYLESIAELDDQVELDSQRIDLMRNPTKAFAAELYHTGIQLWFTQHGRTHDDERIQNIMFDHLD